MFSFLLVIDSWPEMMARSSSSCEVSALASVHVATLLFGLAGVLGATIGLGAIEVTFGRTLFAATALLAVWAYSSSRLMLTTTRAPLTPLVKKPVVNLLLLFSGVLLAFHWVIFFASIQLSTVAIGLVTFSTCPIFVAMLEPFCFGEKFKPSSLLAALLILIGVIVMSGAYKGELVYAQGIAYGIASGLSFAVLQLVNRRLANTSGPLATSLVQNLVAALILLPIVTGGLAAIHLSQWLILAFLGVGCTALAHTLFINALKRVKVVTASLIAAGLEPLYGIALAAIFLSQMPDLEVLLGSAIILVTVLGFTYKQTHELAG